VLPSTAKGEKTGQRGKRLYSEKYRSYQEIADSSQVTPSGTKPNINDVSKPAALGAHRQHPAGRSFNPPWPRDSNQTAAGKPAAVQTR
jgi:hypothetical protein